MTDKISDLLIRVKNGFLANHETVRLHHSKLLKSVADILCQEGYLEEVTVVGDLPKQELVLKLRYINRQPALSEVKRLSKPGRRLYASATQLPKTLGGYGITIVSTSRGMLTDKQARTQKIGGELIAQVW